jgi:HD-GYP domain-containing protein (c-di-GMP phosphodiesterase class II)
MNAMRHNKDSYFSVSFDFILLDKNLPYDIYINSSSHKLKDRFVRIFPLNGILSQNELAKFKEKYHQLYIPESQREGYLKSLVDCSNATDTQKAEVIKDSAIGYLNKVFDSEKEFTTEVLVEAIEGCRDSVESMIDVVQDYDVSEIQQLIGSLSFHDFYTYDHSINVSMYCIILYKAVNPKASRDDIVMAGLGGLLHDLGKIKIPTEIINNPGNLSDEDFQEIKKHPGFGKDLIHDSCSDCCPGVDFSVISRVVYEHHENYNGTGYPNKIKEDEIHLLARITAIADFFDAITTKRSYHDVLSPEDAIELMSKSVGKKLDPNLFEIFTKNVSKLVLKGKSNMKLPDDFDPCQPHNVLPLEKIKTKKDQEDIFKKEDKKEYGKVSADTGFGQRKKKKVS